MKSQSIGKKALIVFFVIVILLSAVAETLICRGGPEWLYLVLMWIPALAATVSNCVSFREKVEDFSAKKLFAMAASGNAIFAIFCWAACFPLCI